MNIDDLQAFLSVARHTSFSLAAEELHLTQPAVSKRIAALENQLNSKLFDRISRKVSLTEAGRALKTHAQRILNEVEDSRRTINNLSGKVSGPLKLATSHHIGLHRLPPVLRKFTHHYDVQLDIRFMDSEAACRAVEQGELELAVVTLPPTVSDSLRVSEIWRDQLTLVTAHDHPLCQVNNITAAQLAEHTAILPARGTFTRELIDQSIDSKRHPLHVMMETNYLETIKMMVSIGLGWSLLPETMIDETLHPHRKTRIQVERQLGIIRHPQRTLSNAAKTFIETCQPG